MSEDFEMFHNTFGLPSNSIKVPDSSIKKYTGRLPEQLLNYWLEHGWSRYAEGLFWTVDPSEYEYLMRDWLERSGVPDPSSYNVIARSAFGDLYLWKNNSTELIEIDSMHSRYSHDVLDPDGKIPHLAVRIFFSCVAYESNDFKDFFGRALQELGTLQPDEMYGFVPALALGGPGDFKHLEKVKTIEHLTFLSQLAPLTDSDALEQ